MDCRAGGIVAQDELFQQYLAVGDLGLWGYLERGIERLKAGGGESFGYG